MKLQEITVKEFNRLCVCGDKGKTYFCNGCVFDEETDNLIAFGWYKDANSEASNYYKVINEFDVPHSEAKNGQYTRMVTGFDNKYEGVETSQDWLNVEELEEDWEKVED